MKNKLEAFVDFPIDGFDLSSYISYKNGQTTYRYMLYAISNHYGGMGGGHYTAYVHVSNKRPIYISLVRFKRFIYFKHVCCKIMKR